MMRHFVTLGLVILGLAGCGSSATQQGTEPASETTLGAATVSSMGGTIQSGSFWMKEGAVAVAFAPAQPGQQDLEFSWILLIKSDWSGVPGRGRSSQTVSPVVQSDGTGATSGIQVEINGKRVDLVDRFRIDPEAKTLVDETLLIDGKPKDLKAGRVFLVDLTTDPPTIEQRAVSLSGQPAKVTDLATIKSAALQARDRVIREDDSARKFVGKTD